MENRRCWCPVIGREITALDCLDAALVYEGISPLTKLQSVWRIPSRTGKPA